MQTCQEAGHAGQGLSDETILAHAAEDDRAVLTLNRRHFIRLHEAKPEHAGIVVCSVDHDAAGQARRIDATIREASPLRRSLLRVNRPA